MNCNKCGTQNPEGVQFCRHCGTRLQSVSPNPANHQMHQAAPGQPFSQQPQGQPVFQQSMVPQPVRPSLFAGFFVKDQTSSNFLSRTAILGAITSILAIITVFIPFLTITESSVFYSFSSLLPFGNASAAKIEQFATTYNTFFGGAGWLIFFSILLLLAGASGVLLSIHYFLQPCCKNKLHKLFFNCVYFVILMTSLYLMSVLWAFVVIGNYISAISSGTGVFVGPAIFFFLLTAALAFTVLVWHPAPIKRVRQYQAPQAAPGKPSGSQQGMPNLQTQAPVPPSMPQQPIQQQAVSQPPTQQPPQNPGAPGMH